jgi:putative endopeptidase
MSPQTVNACYAPNNTVTITVAIMTPPYFDEQADDMTNLGALGFIVAHEVGHAFDSKNIKYDAQGRYNPDWLPAEDLKALEEREKLFSDYFSSYTILDVYHVDGELTMGENYADMGGMECITSLAKNREELRTLFESFAYSWSELASDTDAIEYLSEDVHSPNKVRVNAVLSSSDAFYEAYDVQPGDAMYVKPEDRVRRW